MGQQNLYISKNHSRVLNSSGEAKVASVVHRDFFENTALVVFLKIHNR
jgi:hypothetical protein